MGTHLGDAGDCVPDVACGSGTSAIGGVCLPDSGNGGMSLVCGPGTADVGGECVPTGGGGGSGGASAGSTGSGGTGSGGTGGEGGGGGTGGGGGGGGTSEATGFAVDAAHDNAQPDDVVASPLQPIWTAQLGGGASYPIVTGGLVIVAAAGAQPNVRALDLATGQIVWGPVVAGSAVMPAYDGGHVFTLDENGNLTALDVATGHQLWATQLQGQLSFSAPPVAAGGKVYINGLESGGTTYAVDGSTGATAWTADTFDGSDGAVAVAGGVVYEAEACDQLSAFDAITGHLDWYHSSDCTGGGGAAPAVYDGLIFERDWALGNVIINTSGHAVGSFAADLVPSFHDGTAFYLSSGTLSAVDLQGDTLKWSFMGDGQLCTSAVIAGGGGQVFIGSQSGNVYELDEATGTQKSVHDVGTGVTCGSETQSMAVAAGHLLVPAGDEIVVY